MEYIKNYKSDDALRLSFDALAKQTFGISFETWYQSGCWTDAYVPYSVILDGKVVANASANQMHLVIEGQKVKAIQIGTVMTDPQFRRRGLAQKLIEQIITDHENDVTFFYLAADEDAKSLYQRCGFSEIEEVKYTWQNPVATSLELYPMSMTLSALIELKKASALKGSKLEAVSDEHILAFYYFHGFDEKIYRLKDGTVILADIIQDGEGLHLYEVFSQKTDLNQDIGLNLNAILPITGAKIIKFDFDVSGLVIGLEKEIHPQSGWMVRPSKLSETQDAVNILKGFPKPFSYPKLAQA